MHRRIDLRGSLILAVWLALPACLLTVGPGPGGSSICDARGNCQAQGPSACSEFYDATTCESQGCVWGSFCAGTATPCAYLTPTTCDQQAGCGWDETTGVCAGSEGSCSAFVGTACVYQIGCEDAYGCVEY